MLSCVDLRGARTPAFRVVRILGAHMFRSARRRPVNGLAFFTLPFASDLALALRQPFQKFIVDTHKFVIFRAHIKLAQVIAMRIHCYLHRRSVPLFIHSAHILMPFVLVQHINRVKSNRVPSDLFCFANICNKLEWAR